MSEAPSDFAMFLSLILEIKTIAIGAHECVNGSGGSHEKSRGRRCTAGRHLIDPCQSGTSFLWLYLQDEQHLGNQNAQRSLGLTFTGSNDIDGHLLGLRAERLFASS